MNTFFIHKPIFRILSPLCSGGLIYLLILLINNNVGQLKETFLGQELYICIGFAYLIQEYTQFSLRLFRKITAAEWTPVKLLTYVLITIGVAMLLVSILMYLYYSLVLGFTPNVSDFIIFNSIFSVFTLLYLTLFLSHQFLYKINVTKLEEEQNAKEMVMQDFHQLKKGIHRELLFESLESLLVTMKKDIDKADTLIDHFSMVYRYILSKRNNELVGIREELRVLEAFLALFGYLPYRKVVFEEKSAINTLVVPGTLIKVIEEIIRSTISSDDIKLAIVLSEDSSYIQLKYQPEEKLLNTFNDTKIEDVKSAYQVYTQLNVHIVKNKTHTTIMIPKLSLNESSYY